MVLVTHELLQVERRGVEEALATDAQEEGLRVDAKWLAAGQLGQDGLLGGCKDTVEAAQHGEREDDAAILGLLVVATEEVGHRPEEGGEGLLVHGV